MDDNCKSTSSLVQLVSFRMGNEEFGVDILKVQEINRMLEITKIPNAPDFVEGIVNLRGKILPVIDLRKRLGFEDKEHSTSTRIIVVELSEKTIGFIVDEVNEVLRVNTDIMEPPPALATGVNSEYISCVAKLEDTLLIMLNLEKVFSYTEYQELEKIESD